MAPPERLSAPPAWAGDLADAEAVCWRIATRHYENFSVVTRLVPSRLRQHLANVYAFARWGDDLADENPSGGDAALAEWRAGLHSCFAGHPHHPIYVALAETIHRKRLTIGPFEDLISAFEEDRKLDREKPSVRYASRAELLHYCARSANPVGRIVLALEGCRDPHLLDLSDAICTGLQLVNFWQDLGCDRLAGRIYLPAEDMASHGVAESHLDASEASVELRSLLRDEVCWARSLFDTGAPLIAQAPAVLRPAIRLFIGGGRAIADGIERCGYDTLRTRPTVGRLRKLHLVWSAWLELRSASRRGGR